MCWSVGRAQWAGPLYSMLLSASTKLPCRYRVLEHHGHGRRCRMLFHDRSSSPSVIGALVGVQQLASIRLAVCLAANVFGMEFGLEIVREL